MERHARVWWHIVIWPSLFVSLFLFWTFFLTRLLFCVLFWLFDLAGEKKQKQQDLYMLWGDDESSGFVKGRKAPPRLAMPKMVLPGHKESYNPPAEYLLNAKEQEEWEKLDAEDRSDDFLPSKYPSLKMVPGYKNYCSERFERCRDLYWASRKRVNRLNIKPESLLPRIPGKTSNIWRFYEPFANRCSRL